MAIMLIKIKIDNNNNNNCIRLAGNKFRSSLSTTSYLLWSFLVLISLFSKQLAALNVVKHVNDPNIKCFNRNLAIFNHQSFCLNECVTKSLLESSTNNRTNNAQKQIKSARAQTFTEFDKYCFPIKYFNPDSQNTIHNPQYSQHVQSYFKNEIKQFNLNILLNDQDSETEKLIINDIYYLNVFIFDFRSVSGDIYIDFKQIDEKYLQNLADAAGLKSYLIINLVSTQFVTFRLLNIPNKSQYLDKLFILLNGECSLDIMQSNRPNEEKLSIEVFNSPYYISTDNNEWLHYLKHRFNLNLNERNYLYIQHLSMFCHTFHMRVDLANMILINSRNNQTLNEKLEFVQYMELIDLNYELNLIQECEIMPENNEPIEHNNNNNNNAENDSQYDDNIGINRFSNQIDDQNGKNSNTQNPIYLFEIDNRLQLFDNDDENFLRAYVKECDLDTNYIIILYVAMNKTNINKKKKLVFDDSKCRFQIYSNIDVYDLLDQKIETNKLDYQRLEGNFKNSSELAKKMVAKQFNTKKFYYLKINPKANEIEMRFLTPNQETLVHNSFLNKIKQHVFVAKNEDQNPDDSNSNSNEIIHKDYSIKFVLSESDIMDYFKAHYLNLQNWISIYNNTALNTSTEQNFFFITNKTCKAFYLYKELIYSSYSYLILFNSKMYEKLLNTNETFDHKDLHVKLNDCFYLDKFTNTFYLTFGFSTDYEHYIQTVYFNLNNLHIETQKPSNPDSIKTLNNPNNQFTLTRETHINGYYKTVIEQSINSQCNVDTKLTSNEETKAINLNTLIKMKTLDNLISWKLRVCWFSENECLNQLIDQQSESDFDKDINLSREENEDDDDFSQDLHGDLIADDDLIDPQVSDNHVLKLEPNVNDYDYYHNQMTTLGDVDTASKKTSTKIGQVVRFLSKSFGPNSMKLRLTNHKTYFQLDKNKKIYDYYMNFSIKLNNLEKNLKNKTYLVCNLRPEPSCNHVSYRNESLNISFSPRMENEPFYYKEIVKKCDSNSKVLKSFERNFQMQSRTILLAILNPVELFLNEKNFIKNFSFSFSNQTKNDINCGDMMMINNRNDKNKDLKSTTTSSKLINTTSLVNSDDSKNEKFFYNNRLTIMLLLILVIFLVFCFLIMKKMITNRICCCIKLSKSKKKKRKDNDPSTINNANHEEQQLKLLNNTTKTSNNIETENEINNNTQIVLITNHKESDHV